MYDSIANKYRNHFHSHQEAGAKPDPYNPDWVKKEGKWYYKGELHQPETTPENTEEETEEEKRAIEWLAQASDFWGKKPTEKQLLAFKVSVIAHNYDFNDDDIRDVYRKNTVAKLKEMLENE